MVENKIFSKLRIFSDQSCVNLCFHMTSFTEEIFVSQNNEAAAMFVSQTSPVGIELFSYVNAFFCSNKFA